MGRTLVFAFVLSFVVIGNPVAAGCPGDSVQSGTVCIDKYEASVWHVPPTDRDLVGRIQRGTVSHEQLIAAGAAQVGVTESDLTGLGCGYLGNGCVDVYAASIPGVIPANFITWFQAAAAARNSLKRLPANQEWQVAAAGTPDGGPCNVSTGAVRVTGFDSGCVSDIGVFDMVGNVDERVAEWGDAANGCTVTKIGFGADRSCVGGPGSGYLLLAAEVKRGGHFDDGTGAGVLAIDVRGLPGGIGSGHSGFRAVR